MARITVEGCLDKVESRFELILLASGRARQLSTTSREPMVEWEDDKPTIVALREIEEGLITCLLYTSPSPRDATLSRMPSSA